MAPLLSSLFIKFINQNVVIIVGMYVPPPRDVSLPRSMDPPRKNGLPLVACAWHVQIHNHVIGSRWPFDSPDSRLDHSMYWSLAACTRRIRCDESYPRQCVFALEMIEKDIDRSKIERCLESFGDFAVETWIEWQVAW